MSIGRTKRIARIAASCLMMAVVPLSGGVLLETPAWAQTTAPSLGNAALVTGPMVADIQAAGSNATAVQAAISTATATAAAAYNPASFMAAVVAATLAAANGNAALTAAFATATANVTINGVSLATAIANFAAQTAATLANAGNTANGQFGNSHSGLGSGGSAGCTPTASRTFC